jgi:hypothetical protein
MKAKILFGLPGNFIPENKHHAKSVQKFDEPVEKLMY